MDKKKILVVDDETDFLFITKLNLELTGKFEVLTLPGAQNIFSQIVSFRPELIMLDIFMPGIDGLDACDMLSRDPISKDIPVIILTAMDKGEFKARAFNLGVAHYLAKPIGIEELVAKIEEVLQQK